MPELVYFVAVSLDGRIAGPGDDWSAFPQTGDHLEWIVADYPETLPAFAHEAMGVTVTNRRFTSVVMGWQTYAVGFPAGVTDPYPHLEQVVATRTHGPDDVPGGAPAGVTFTDDPLAHVRRLKAGDGTGVWLCGGGSLATALADEIDRLVLKVQPVVLGDGTPLFAPPYRPAAWEPVRRTPFESGVVVSEYVRRRPEPA